MVSTCKLLWQLAFLQVAAGVANNCANSQLAGMDVISCEPAGQTHHERVLIMLHGGGESGDMWMMWLNGGYFGNTSGWKYVFPTSPISSHVWFNTYKNGCGEADDCAYDIPSIESSASAVATLIEQEKRLVGGHGSNVYLAGFSEGAQLTGYMQLAKLDFALGGTIVMDGFPLPPLFDMVGHSQSDARKNASYYGTDMRFMIWHGTADGVFPVNFTINTWNGIFDALGVRSTLKVEHIEPNMQHTLIPSEFDKLVTFIGGTPANHSVVNDYLCFMGKCYQKPGGGTLSKDACTRTCHSASEFWVV
jgi:predicted esterase